MRQAPLLRTVAFSLLAGCTPADRDDDAALDARSTAVDASDSTQVYQALEQIDVEWEQAANRGDAAAIASLYADGATFLPPNAGIVQGRENIRQALQGFVDAGMRNVDFTRVQVGYSGDLAYEVGRYSLDLQPPGSQAVTDTGKYVIVARRQPDGSWRLVTDIFNTSQPAPTTPR